MCNHIYTSDYSKAPRGLGIKCPYTSLYESLTAVPPIGNTSAGLNLSIPIDPTGACLFHSTAVGWKRANGFAERFVELLHILDARPGGPSYYDLAEFVFVGESSKELLHLSGLTFQKQALLTGASFLDSVELIDVNFANGAMFVGATFHGDLALNRVSLHGADFSRALFKGRAAFQKTAFDSYALFGKTRFAGSSVVFDESSFEGITEFSNAIFELGDVDSVVFFRNVQFRDFLDFKGAAFNSHVIFEGVSFSSVAEFIDTTFKLVASAARYRGAAVEFKQIGVLEGADLTFKSTDSSRKLFDHDVTFSFKGEPRGVLHFENVNFNEITAGSRKILTELARSGKVEIGSGCIKYRFQTEIKAIPISHGNSALILEIAGTFANYFTVQNGINLGLEVVGRNPTHISLFYFTDEDIQEIEFFARLRQAEHDLWNLLAISPDVLRLLDGSVEALTTPQNAIINAVDGVSALIGTFFRVGIRIAAGRWHAADTRSLLEAIRFNEDSVDLRAATLHKIILGRYTGRNLVGISRAQNEGLPQIEAVGRGLLIGDEGPGGNRTQPSKVIILFLGANDLSDPLQLGEEVSKIQMNLKLAKERDRFVFRQELAVTIDTLMQSILDESPNIVHFSGHGEEGGIFLQDSNNNPVLVAAEALEKLFKLCKETVTCVVLSSCFSEHQARAIRAHIPYVIGIESDILDAAAIDFSSGFYKALGRGLDVPHAFEWGKLAMELWGYTGESAAVLL
jgi:uncharacterized protein YjbI with pentapeptide repeats